MKNLYIAAFIFTLCLANARAQESTFFDLGNGAILSLNNGDYIFSVGGNLKSSYQFAYDTAAIISGKHSFNINHAQFSLSGKAKNEKMSFHLLADYVNTWALLEAWVGFDLLEDHLFLAAGQKLVNTNNRELITHQNYFQFVQPSLLSTNFARLGREFGLFVEGSVSVGNMVIKPSLNITSGDGINSFGNGTTDRFDYGGAKFGGRVELYPMGEFSQDNNFLGSDLARETTPKFSIGGAFSTNQGASESVGEGHGNFLFYSQIRPDGTYRDAFPNYQKIYADLVMKYQGFNFGAEYVNAFGSEVFGLFTNADAASQTPIYRGDISNYLALGTGLNVQTGYITKDFWSLDLRFTKVQPEFENESLSVITNQQAFTLGLSKFLKGQAMKIQVNTDFMTFDQLENTALVEKGEVRGSVAVQIIF